METGLYLPVATGLIAMGVVIYISPIKPKKVGPLQKIWETESTQINGNLNPVYLQIKENFILQAVDLGD
jgi:hypothetical protein